MKGRTPRDLDAHCWVFAYGSNMDMPDLARWVREEGVIDDAPSQIRSATLLRHQLVWNYRSVARRGGAANIEPGPENLPGVVLEVTEALLHAIDRKEGPSYARAVHRVATPQGEIDAWAYRVIAERREATPIYPRQDYLEIMLRAARLHELPKAHISALENTPTLD